MTWIIRILLFLVIVSVIRSLLTRVFSPTLKTHSSPRFGSDRARETVEGQMIKDPQCGMYVAADLAITKRLKGKTLHFCSEECGDNFINQRKRSDQPNRQAV
jgi:YHS domain-containing protein